MPLPAKLPVKLVADFGDPAIQESVREYLLEHGTSCEYMGECDVQAMYGYATAWTVVWVCTVHYTYLNELSVGKRTVTDRLLSEYRYELFLRRSYVHTNNKTNFELERMITIEQNEERRKAKNETERRSAARREIRKQLESSTIKVGAADEDLLTARQRNDARRAAGQPAIGKAPSTMPLGIPQLF